MRLRQKKGGTLALVAAATITLILLGICFFFLAQIFGGEREIQHATDSGNLNVAKNAMRRPFVALNPGIEADTFGQLGDRSLIGGAAPSPNNLPPVNLLTYDRLMAQAMLACINASASSGSDPNNNAVGNAQKLVDALQTGPNSVGGRLSTALSSQAADNPLLTNYSDTADQNSLRMLGPNSTMTRKDNEFMVSYLEQTPADIGATNIAITNMSLIPVALQGSLLTSKNGVSYLRGYVKPAVGGIANTPVGVPMQPGDQPHLVSNKTFQEQIARGGAISTTMVPPNSFRSTSAAQETQTQQNATTVACAEVGSLAMTFPLSAPFGYIKIVNGPDTGGTDSVPGPFVGLDHVLNNELLNPGGIIVAGNVFSTDQGALNNWAYFNADPSGYLADPATPKVNGQPPLTGNDNGTQQPLFKLDGTPATAADMAAMPYSGTGSAATANGTSCTDNNSTGWSRTDTGVVGQCWDELNNGSFDKAYHPGGSYTTGAGTTDNGSAGGGLLSVECAKCQLQHKFNTCTDLSITSGNGSGNCPTTGLRTPQPGKDWTSQESPSSAATCQISNDDTVQNLGNFVSAGFGDQLDQFIAQRALQIIPKDLGGGAGDGSAQYTALKGQALVLGKSYYLYAPNPDANPPGSGKPPKPAQNLVLDTTGPAWLVSGTAPDGAPVTKTHGPYNIVLTAVNPHHDRGIHDIMYRDTPGSGINATDTATWTPSSGFQNLLGEVQFTDSASGYAAGFCKPD